MCEVKANAKFYGHELNDISVINPGDWFGKTWLLEIGGSYSPLFLIVEADNVTDAIDELADSETLGHHIVVADEDLSAYDPESSHYGPRGQVIDLDHLVIHGMENSDCPFPCRYIGDGLPTHGVKPIDFCCCCDD